MLYGHGKLEFNASVSMNWESLYLLQKILEPNPKPLNYDSSIFLVVSEVAGFTKNPTFHSPSLG